VVLPRLQKEYSGQSSASKVRVLKQGIKRKRQGRFDLGEKIWVCFRKEFEVSQCLLVLLGIQTFIVGNCLGNANVHVFSKLCFVAYHVCIFALNIHAYNVLIADTPEARQAVEWKDG
jgi:hypothetical protein